MARPTKLTPQLQKKLIKLLKTGVTIVDACSHVGIAESTYYEWMQRGKADDAETLYAEFMEAVTRAHGDAKVVAIGTLRAAMSPTRVRVVVKETVTEPRFDPDGKKYDHTKTLERETVTVNPGDWRAAVEYLKRRFSDEWVEHFDHTSGGKPFALQITGVIDDDDETPPADDD